jgi:hypothetical protein
LTLTAVLPLHAAAPAPHLTVDQMISMVKKDLSKADEEQRKDVQEKPKERPQTFGTTVGTKQQRLAKGIERAHQMAPNKWYQAAKVEDITPPGDDARKVYQITSPLGTYCVRYADKNRTWDHGQANLGEPLIGACPHMF